LNFPGLDQLNTLEFSGMSENIFLNWLNNEMNLLSKNGVNQYCK